MDPSDARKDDPDTPTNGQDETEIESEIARLAEFDPLDELGSDVKTEEESKLLRNSALMAGATIVSRITGIGRNMALVAAIATGISADAFTLGRALPDAIYALLIGGALTAIFVPQLVRRMKDDADGGKSYTDSLLTVTGIALLVVTVAAVAAAPLLIDLYATDSYTSAQRDLAIAFARYCLPQIFFFGIYAMLGQILNARGKFTMPMAAPIFNNLVAIATYVSFIAIFGFKGNDEELLSSTEAAWIGIGTTLGIVAQALVLIPVVRKAGYRWRFTTKWRGMGLTKAGRLAGWTIGLVAVTQVGVIVISRLTTQANTDASEAGAVSAGFTTWTNAYLVYMIPHGIVTVSIVTAQLPGLSRMVHAGRERIAGLEIGHTMRLVMTVITPIAIVLTLTGEPLAILMFSYGASGVEQAQIVGRVISVLMIGLPAFTLYYVLQRGWYARENTRTPFFLAILTQGVLITFALIWFPFAGPGGPQVIVVAAAMSIGNVITLLVAWPLMARIYGTIDSRRTIGVFARLTVATLLAAAVSYTTNVALNTSFEATNAYNSAVLNLVVTTVTVTVVFVLSARLLRVPEMHEVLSWGSKGLRRLLRRPV